MTPPKKHTSYNSYKSYWTNSCSTYCSNMMALSNALWWLSWGKGDIFECRSEEKVFIFFCNAFPKMNKERRSHFSDHLVGKRVDQVTQKSSYLQTYHHKSLDFQLCCIKKIKKNQSVTMQTVIHFIACSAQAETNLVMKRNKIKITYIKVLAEILGNGPLRLLNERSLQQKPTQVNQYWNREREKQTIK